MVLCLYIYTLGTTVFDANTSGTSTIFHIGLLLHGSGPFEIGNFRSERL